MISTHILDTTLGTPAGDVEVILEKFQEEKWIIIDKNKTNTDGRILFNSSYEMGEYRLTFFTKEYYKNASHFFLNPVIHFLITNTNRKYHVPLIINPYGYSTYRGS
jgi:5-hydroxyisourate hydrolase